MASALRITGVLVLAAATLPHNHPATAQLDTLSHGGLVREYLVHLPAAYDESQSWPVVVAFHGGFGSETNIEHQSQLSVVADEEGFIAVYPRGTGIIRTWNGGECCGSAARDDVDDVGFVRALLRRLPDLYNVDLQRTYATGISNGGAMTYRLACEASDVFAAFAPVAATYRNPACTPHVAVPIIHFHSVMDENVPIEGGQGSGPSVVDWLPLDSTLSNFAGHNGCTTRTSVQVTDSLSVTTWGDCDMDHSVNLYLTTDGGHSWPGGMKTGIGDSVSTAVDASREMWRFFQLHVIDFAVTIENDNRENANDVRQTPIRVYPNPSKGDFRIEVDVEQGSAVSVSLFDVTGRLVAHSNPTFLAAGTHEINLSVPVGGLVPGRYVVTATVGARLSVSTIAIVR